MESNQKERKNDLLFIILLFALSIVCIVFSTLCIYGSKNAFVSKYATLFSVLSAVIFAAFSVISICFLYRKKETLLKTCLSIYIFLALILIFIYVLQITDSFEIIKDAERLQAFLEKAGVWMPILYIFLQFLQVVVLPIPSIVSTAAGVALFGAFQTTVFSLIGILLGSFIAFLIGRKLGYKAVAWMVGKETLDKWQRKLKGKDNLFLTLMFLLPLFPDDVLCFIAGLSSMSMKYFLWMMLVSRVLAITATCYSIDFIPLNTWWGILLWSVFIIGIVAAFVIIYKNMDKIQKIWGEKVKSIRKRNKK